MIKNLLFAATAFVALSLGANAQTTQFDEGFEDTSTLGDWILVDGDGDGIPWGVMASNSSSVTAGFEGAFAFSESFNNEIGPLTPDNLLVTPSFTIPEEGTGTLTYDIGAIDPNYFAEHYSVYVVPNAPFEDEETTVGEILDLLTDDNNILSETLSTHMSTTKTLSLIDFAGQDVRVVFRHHDIEDVYVILLDNVKVVTNTTTSTENFAKLGLNVFPNPVSDMVNITSPEANIEAVTITDLNGRTVKSINFNNVAEITIDASDLASGIYLMNITANGTVATQKIVKK